MYVSGKLAMVTGSTCEDIYNNNPELTPTAFICDNSEPIAMWLQEVIMDMCYYKLSHNQ